MSRQIRIKVHPNETLRFPGLCVNCGSPAAERMALKQCSGRTIRQVDVPLCDQCAGELQRESGQEERMRKMSWLIITAVAILVAVTMLLVLPASVTFWMRLLLSLLGGVIAAVIMRRLFRGIINRAALPGKKAVRESAQLVSFSWRTATFVFTNEPFIDRFIELNEPLLVET